MKPILKSIVFSLSISILFGCAVKTTKNVSIYKIKIVGQIGSIDEYGNAVLDRKSSEQAKAHLKLGDSLSVRFDESQESLTCKMVKDYGDVPVGDYLARFDNDTDLLKLAINQGQISKTNNLKQGMAVEIDAVR